MPATVQMTNTAVHSAGAAGAAIPRLLLELEPEDDEQKSKWQCRHGAIGAIAK